MYIDGMEKGTGDKVEMEGMDGDGKEGCKTNG